jgi:sugar phosphate isomerase/epimerase
MGYPRLSMAECTTYTASFEDDLAAYAAAGCDGIGLWEYKLPKGKDERLLEALHASGLKATICVPKVPCLVPDGLFSEPKHPSDRRRGLCAAIRRLAAFDPVAILVLTGAPGENEVETRRIVVDGLRAAADVAGEVGVTLGLEPLRKTSGTLITTLPEAAEMIDEIGAPNVKIIYDTWHFWDLPNVLEDLRTYVGQFVGIQVNDWRDLTRSWCDRLIPGDGGIDLASIFGALDAAGYQGWYDVEILSDDGRFGHAFSDSIWKLPPDDVARRSVDGFRAAWEKRIAPNARS